MAAAEGREGGSGVELAGGGAHLEERRAAVTRLGAEVRALTEAMVATEVPTAALDEAVARLRAVTRSLCSAARPLEQLSSVDDLRANIRMFNPVSGAASPVAPPLVMEDAEDGLIGYVTLGLVHEGHFMYAHGGVTAALLDDALGRAATKYAHPGVTSRLIVRYRRPVPLRTALVVRVTVEAVEGRRFTIRGTVRASDTPDVVLAEADGWFVRLTPAQSTAMFGSDQLHGQVDSDSGGREGAL